MTQQQIIKRLDRMILTQRQGRWYTVGDMLTKLRNALHLELHPHKKEPPCPTSRPR